MGEGKFQYQWAGIAPAIPEPRAGRVVEELTKIVDGPFVTGAIAEDGCTAGAGVVREGLSARMPAARIAMLVNTGPHARAP